MNPLYLGHPEDRCSTCGTNLRTSYGQTRPCPIHGVQDDEPEDAA
jgi:hypothetical protein